MSIKNGNMPAIPMYDNYGKASEIFCDKGESYRRVEGLTKRETFAMNAPVMPPWFELEFLQNPELNKGKDFLITNGYECATSEDGKKAMFMAWPAYYADALLAQLEEKGDE